MKPKAKMDNFNLLKTPLKGVNLIEASAGTGKTYTITGLFLRLIIEMDLSVDQVLVVTYTEAAAAELKDRIRNRLMDARDAFIAGKAEDVFISDLIDKYKHMPAAPYRVTEAIRCFDQASIYTIHGFCMRTLYENAFESGSLFDTELMENQMDMEIDTVCDFWRTRVYSSSTPFVRYLLKKNTTPDSLLVSIGNSILHPGMKIIPDRPEIADTEIMEREFRDIYRDASEEWRSSKDDIISILLDADSLNRNKYRKKSILNWIADMDKMMSPLTAGSLDLCGPPLFKEFEKFTSGMIGNSIKKDCIAPSHHFFDLCDMLWRRSGQLESVYDGVLKELKRDLIDFIRTEMATRKQRDNIRTFDDLLMDVHDALFGEKGNALAAAIRESYSAALIDEFQDTDPIQYSIFHRVYGQGDSILFLIGDPKQAIYGFRGADIFTYIKAAKKARNVYTLKENYRSEPGLINAVNTIFTNAAAPFLFDNIHFETINPPALPVSHDELAVSGEERKPFIIWRVDTKTNDGGSDAGGGQPVDRMLADAVAGEIFRLLDLSGKGIIHIGGRAFESGDAAVLVRTNREAELVKDSLSRLGIPGVVYGSGNVFDSKEARELGIVLSGIIRPDKESYLKAALATEMIGVTFEDLLLEKDSHDKIERHREIFLKCRNIWYGQGFMKMFRMLLREENIMTTLIEFFDGERRITNLLHLAEILQRKSVISRTDAEDLMKWYQRQLDPLTTRLREEQLRLESDENAVRIITIHKSKGLEFPVVFCPFLSGPSILRKNAPVLFHDNTEDRSLILDLGSEQMDTSRTCAERELLAENLRLAYVALTRAKHRCYMIWGRLKNGETSAPAYLLHQPATVDGDIALRVKERYLSLDEEGLSKDLDKLSGKSSGTIIVAGLPQRKDGYYSNVNTKPEDFASRVFKARPERKWRVSSFSSIAHGQYIDDTADHDGLTTIDNPPEMDGVDPAFLFPKGATAGTCLHDIFEHIDFTDPYSDQTRQTVEEKLLDHGFGTEWTDTIFTMVKNVLSVSLDRDDDGFSLNRISDSSRLHELEFYYPVDGLVPRELGKIFSNTGSPLHSKSFSQIIGTLDSKELSGYLKGFIDLIFHYNGRFYIVDWKSNFLGYHRQDYGQAELSREMIKRLYFLQYHIYAVALHKYLMLRKPDYDYGKHFGGVYYLFLRGISGNADDDSGVFYDKPDEALIGRLCIYFDNK